MQQKPTGKITPRLGLPLILAAALSACGGGTDTTATPAASAGPTRLLATTATANAPRTMENLGRGVVAVQASATNVFISWRLLGLEPSTLAFNLYRSANGAAPVKLNGAPLTAGTSFTDTTSVRATDRAYTVRPVIDGVEQAASEAFTLSANHAIEPIVRIPLAALPGANYKTKYVWVGDLDGDGEYDFVIDRLAPLDATNDDIGLGNQYLEAYKRDGTRLWQIDMGPSSRKTYNIHPGAATLSMGMYDGVTVFDLDGDGKAEVILKVADGVKFPDGTTFTTTNKEKQSIAILNGLTGKMLANREFPANFDNADPLPKGYGGSLGTQLGIGYPDGISPSIYFWGRNRNTDKSFNDVFASWSWKGGSTITENFVLPIAPSVGTQASHQMRIIDLDGDGKDEMMTGNFVVNSDGTIRYILPGVIHGDRFYVGKFDATSPGMQGYGIQQNNPSGLLEYYYNATTGVINWNHSTSPGTIVDVGRGLVGDVDARFPGFEVWSFSGLTNGLTGSLTEPNTSLSPYPTQQIWWDGDLLSEGLNDYKIEKWNPLVPKASNALPRLLTMSSSPYLASIWDHNPMFMGDIMGDWRTEVVTLNQAHTELVIFTTNVPTTTRLYTMAHNPAYRNHMTLKGYMQSPTLDYYLGDGMSPPPEPNIRYAGSGTIQGETAVLDAGTDLKTDRSGYHGTGFIDFPAAGGGAQFNNINGGAGGVKNIVIRFANGNPTPRTGVLRVNGVAQSIRFNATGGWTNWSNLTVPVTLAAGMGNTLRFESTGQDLGNIDEVTVP